MENILFKMFPFLLVIEPFDAFFFMQANTQINQENHGKLRLTCVMLQYVISERLNNCVVCRNCQCYHRSD